MVGYWKSDVSFQSNCSITRCFDLQGCSILDLGCGRGGGLSFLAQNYKIQKSVGIDISQQQISLAQENQSSQNLANIDFRVGDVENLLKVEVIQDLINQSQWGGFDIILSIENMTCLDDIN